MAATTTKTVNYTSEQEAVMMATAEKAGGVLTHESAEMFAADFGKTVKSVVAKLSRMGIYQKKEYKTKNGEAVVKKDSLADKLAEIVGLSEAETESLTKANKTALAKIIAKLEG